MEPLQKHSKEAPRYFPARFGLSDEDLEDALGQDQGRGAGPAAPHGDPSPLGAVPQPKRRNGAPLGAPDISSGAGVPPLMDSKVGFAEPFPALAPGPLGPEDHLLLGRIEDEPAWQFTPAPSFLEAVPLEAGAGAFPAPAGAPLFDELSPELWDSLLTPTGLLQAWAADNPDPLLALDAILNEPSPADSPLRSALPPLSQEALKRSSLHVSSHPAYVDKLQEPSIAADAADGLQPGGTELLHGQTSQVKPEPQLKAEPAELGGGAGASDVAAWVASRGTEYVARHTLVQPGMTPEQGGVSTFKGYVDTSALHGSSVAAAGNHSESKPAWLRPRQASPVNARQDSDSALRLSAEASALQGMQTQIDQLEQQLGHARGLLGGVPDDADSNTASFPKSSLEAASRAGPVNARENRAQDADAIGPHGLPSVAGRGSGDLDTQGTGKLAEEADAGLDSALQDMERRRGFSAETQARIRNSMDWVAVQADLLRKSMVPRQQVAISNATLPMKPHAAPEPRSSDAVSARSNQVKPGIPLVPGSPSDQWRRAETAELGRLLAQEQARLMHGVSMVHGAEAAVQRQDQAGPGRKGPAGLTGARQLADELSKPGHPLAPGARGLDDDLSQPVRAVWDQGTGQASLLARQGMGAKDLHQAGRQNAHRRPEPEQEYLGPLPAGHVQDLHRVQAVARQPGHGAGPLTEVVLASSFYHEGGATGVADGRNVVGRNMADRSQVGSRARNQAAGRSVFETALDGAAVGSARGGTATGGRAAKAVPRAGGSGQADSPQQVKADATTAAALTGKPGALAARKGMPASAERQRHPLDTSAVAESGLSGAERVGGQDILMPTVPGTMGLHSDDGTRVALGKLHRPSGRSGEAGENTSSVSHLGVPPLSRAQAGARQQRGAVEGALGKGKRALGDGQPAPAASQVSLEAPSSSGAAKSLIPSEARGTLSSHWALLGHDLQKKGVTLGLERFVSRPMASSKTPPSPTAASPEGSSEDSGKDASMADASEASETSRRKLSPSFNAQAAAPVQPGTAGSPEMGHGRQGLVPGHSSLLQRLATVMETIGTEQHPAKRAQLGGHEDASLAQLAAQRRLLALQSGQKAFQWDPGALALVQHQRAGLQDISEKLRAGVLGMQDDWAHLVGPGSLLGQSQIPPWVRGSDIPSLSPELGAGARIMLGLGGSMPQMMSAQLLHSPFPSTQPSSNGFTVHSGTAAALKHVVMLAGQALESKDSKTFQELCSQLRGVAKRRGTAIERAAQVMLDALVLRAEGKGFTFVNKRVRISNLEFNQARMWYFTGAPFYTFSDIAISGMILPVLKGRANVHLVIVGEGIIPQMLNMIRLLSQPPHQGLLEGAPGASEDATSTPHQPLANGTSSTGVESESPSEGYEGPLGETSRLERLRVTNIASWHLVRPGRTEFEAMKESGRVANLLGTMAKSMGVAFEYQGLKLMEGSTSANRDLLSRAVTHRKDEVVAFVGFPDSKFLPDEPSPEGGYPQLLMQFLRDLRPDIIGIAEEDVDANAESYLPRLDAHFDFSMGMYEAHDALSDPSGRKAIYLLEQHYLNLNTYSALACEGSERRLHPRSAAGWARAFLKGGFTPCPINQEVSDAEHELLSCFPDGFGLIQDGCTLRLMWKGTPLMGASFWILGNDARPSWPYY